MSELISTRRSLLVAAGSGAVALTMAAQARAQQDGHLHQALTPEQKEARAFKFLALKMFVEVDSDDTKGAVSIVRVFVPAGEGVSPHVHSREDEVFTVVRGRYRFRHGDAHLDAPAGTVVFMPRGVPHVFKNVGNEPGEHLTTLIPGGLEKMFREISDAGLQMPRDIEKRDEFFAKYGLKGLPPSSFPLSDG